MADWVAIDLAESRVRASCLRVKAYSEMARAMLWISTSAVAIPTPTALRTRDRRKPAPAMPIMDAMMLLDVRDFSAGGNRNDTYLKSAMSVALTRR